MLILAFTQSLSGQTFRAGIAGTVQDTTGAVVANAKISLIGTETGSKRETISTSSGDYRFQDLPLETYNVVAEAPGFSTTKIDKIVVRPGQIYSLEIKLSVASSAQQVEVNAAAASLDTESSTNADVVNEKAVENIPLNGRDFTQLVKVVPGYNGAGSLNGTRTNQNNSSTGEFQDRPNQIGNPTAGVNRALITPSSGAPYAQWFTSAAFVPAPAGSFGTLHRNVFRGPGFVTVDAAVVKNTMIHEGINLQLRAEMFNLFNRTNLANPGVGTLSSSTFGRSTSTHNNGGAPGIGPGEPFNVQHAGKIIF
jgi:hypothetical protein